MSKQNQSVREVLETPFREEQIKHRPGNFGQELAYVEGHAVIKRLNEAFDGAWSFEVCEHRVLEGEALVLGKLTCELGTKMAFGGSSVTHAKETGEIVSLVDDLKAASTDAIKKCATLLGVGLHLYESETKPSKGNGYRESGRSNGEKTDSSGNGSSRITAKQLAYVYALVKGKGMSKDDLQRLTISRFDRMPDFITKHEASDLIQELQN